MLNTNVDVEMAQITLENTNPLGEHCGVRYFSYLDVLDVGDWKHVTRAGKR